MEMASSKPMLMLMLMLHRRRLCIDSVLDSMIEEYIVLEVN